MRISKPAMAYGTLGASVTFVRRWVAVTSIFAPDLVAGSGGRNPIDAMINPICGAIATKYVVRWVKRK